MTSETTSSAMSEKATGRLVPKLRFPEYRGATLRSVLLGDVTEECRRRNGNKHSAASVMGVTKADGIVPMESRLIASDLARYKLVETDCFAYNPMRLNIGSIARWMGQREILVSPDYIVFKCITNNEPRCDPGYLDQFRKTKAWEEFVSEGGDGSVRIRIYYKDIARICLSLPPLPEQQKIANCLSSLDELIAAQAQKVEALTTYKKGLMQQLFPRTGETQPRLRFPEFQGAGEWEVKRVNEHGTVLAGKALAVKALGPLRPYLRTKNVMDGFIDLSDVLTMPMTDAEFSRFEILDGDVLLNEGQSLDLVGRAAIYLSEFKDRCAMQNQLLRFRAFPTTCAEFAAQYFRKCQKDGTFASVATKTTSVAHLGSSRFSALKLAWPSLLEEQQCIASCLSDLDALITAESEKLEAIKSHKKGLLQQLFPSAEEVEA